MSTSVRHSTLLARILRHEPQRARVVTDPARRAAAGLRELATLRYQSRNIPIYRLADSYGA